MADDRRVILSNARGFERGHRFESFQVARLPSLTGIGGESPYRETTCGSDGGSAGGGDREIGEA